MTAVDPGFWTTAADVAAAVCLLAGAFLTAAAAVGTLRFDSLVGRLHAVTKPQVLGLILLLLALALRIRSWSAVSMLALVIVFQLATAPVAAHLLSRAGFRTGKVDESLFVPNEMGPSDGDHEDHVDPQGPGATRP
ncbi:multisubunit sodium/proton antiporter MrpG subunit [Isoptericola jiangsuensis]|uniref:Multisubunit sodium/proton antiporter MrpG subunit n=1 Tax=Isoptericola jiangsuensis TaxID=548579 RepID=A0A2A9ETY6_9MICO|nr:monovalent cation/H(+) antiporter subunit G [Isoptericola jiangsuensis]PFG41750.1 multisubunit sodium/proton antiporter MrpG subunit [Isoptericola jiangsuensis]